MRIHQITLRNYRGTAERTLEFRDGVTVIESRNEMGRSALVGAFQHLRFHKASTSRKEVHDTQPVEWDVGPEAETRLSTGEYHLTYCKRWLKGRRTELNITAPRPEKLSGDDAHKRFSQAVAGTTDDGLPEALEAAQGNFLGQTNLTRLPTFRRALDETGPSTGEYNALLEAVGGGYLRYFTPTGKPTGDYAQGQRDLGALTGKTWLLEVASREIDSLTEKYEKAVTARGAKRKRLGQTCQQETEFAKENRLLGELRQRVKRAAARVTEADAAREITERLACEREDARMQVRELDITLAKILTRIERTRQRTSSAQDTLAFHAEETRDVEEEEGVLRARLCGVDNRVRQAHDVVELEALKERLERFMEAERRLHEAATVLDVNIIDDKTCRMLEKLEVTARITRGIWEIGATRVAIEMADTILLDEEALESGVHDPILAKAPVVIEIPGHAEITVLPGDGTDDVERRARDAGNALIKVLASHGVPSIVAARVMAGRDDRAEWERSAVNETIRMILGDKNDAELRVRAEALTKSVEGVDVGELAGAEGERSGVATAVGAAGDRAVGTRVVLESARTTQQEAREDLIREETELCSLEAHRDGAVLRLEAARVRVPDEKIGAAVTEAVAVLEKCVAEKSAVDEELEPADAAGLEARPGGTHAMVTRLMKGCGDLDEELIRLSTLLDDRLVGDTYDRLSETRAWLGQAEARQTSRQCAADTVDLLRKTLNHHCTEAQLHYVAPFRGRIGSLGRLVFGPDPVVEVTPELNTTFHTLAGETMPFQSLSSEAREQFSLLGRLACVQLVQPGGGVPLIIDDVLGFTDSERLARLGVVLNRVGDSIQTITLTCQPERSDQIEGTYVIRL